MGWLRELMASASPQVEGYGELARRALGHSEWPADTRPQPRSLAALFSKLDRAIELEWLAEREAVQRTLALVLGCPVELIRKAATPDGSGTRPTSVRWVDLPYARPLALRDEPLPPGFPAAVLAPATWRRLWWRAPPGSGRSLAGCWLEARGLARYISAVRWTEAAGCLPGAAPLFLELERGDDLEGLDAALPEAGVCVAAPAPPPRRDGTAPPWEEVSSPGLLEALPSLLAWLEARLPRDGAFEAAAAEAWLRPPIERGQLPTLGALLGAAGLLDARGVREARGKALAEVAEPFVNERLARASLEGGAEAQWLERFGFDALIRLAKSALAASDAAWDVARSQDEWIALVPPELQTSVDAAWARGALGRGAGRAPSRGLERAVEAAPPGAYRLVRALVGSGLLAERAPGRLTVSPEFLKHVVLARATAELAEDTPFAWGEALLRPHAAPAVLDALYRRLADDLGPIEQLAELEVPSHPALVAATEATLVCLGLRALCGADVPAEQLEAVWNEQLGWLVELPGELPRPRLLCYAHHEVSVLARHAVWMLALLAASELLGERQGRAHPLLRPWGAPLMPEVLNPMLDAIYVELARPEVAQHDWAIEAFALAGRLLEGDALDEPELRAVLWHPLGRPSRLARALLEGGLDGAWLDGLGDHPLELRALEAACTLRHVAWPRMAHALWKTWQSRGCPARDARLFSPDGPYRELLWPHLPPEVLGAAWTRWTPHAPWPYASFSAVQWSAFVDYFGERWQREPDARVWREAFEHLNLEQTKRAVDLGQLLDSALLDSALPAARVLLERVWQRFPAWFSTRLRECAAAGEARAVTRLLDAAPAPLEDDLMRPFADELSRRSTRREIIDAARSWLCAKVSARRGDWRAAYALLAELEGRLARAERARGVSAAFG